MLCRALVAVQLRVGGGLVSCSRATLLRTMSGTMGAWARNANADPQVRNQGNGLFTPMHVLCVPLTLALCFFHPVDFARPAAGPGPACLQSEAVMLMPGFQAAPVQMSAWLYVGSAELHNALLSSSEVQRRRHTSSQHEM
jgi:hypothetical protein